MATLMAYFDIISLGRGTSTPSTKLRVSFPSPQAQRGEVSLVSPPGNGTRLAVKHSQVVACDHVLHHSAKAGSASFQTCINSSLTCIAPGFETAKTSDEILNLCSLTK